MSSKGNEAQNVFKGNMIVLDKNFNQIKKMTDLAIFSILYYVGHITIKHIAEFI